LEQIEQDGRIQISQRNGEDWEESSTEGTTTFAALSSNSCQLV